VPNFRGHRDNDVSGRSAVRAALATPPGGGGEGAGPPARRRRGPSASRTWGGGVGRTVGSHNGAPNTFADLVWSGWPVVQCVGRTRRRRGRAPADPDLPSLRETTAGSLSRSMPKLGLRPPRARPSLYRPAQCVVQGIVQGVATLRRGIGTCSRPRSRRAPPPPGWPRSRPTGRSRPASSVRSPPRRRPRTPGAGRRHHGLPARRWCGGLLLSWISSVGVVQHREGGSSPQGHDFLS
jgi:hypothetical protein